MSYRVVVTALSFPDITVLELSMTIPMPGNKHFISYAYNGYSLISYIQLYVEISLKPNKISIFYANFVLMICKCLVRRYSKTLQYSCKYINTKHRLHT